MEKKTVDDDGVRGNNKKRFSCEPLGSFKSSFFAKGHVRPEAAATSLWRKKKRRAAVNCAEKKRKGRAAVEKKRAAVDAAKHSPRLASLLALDPFESPENDGRYRETCRIHGGEQKEHERGRVF